MIPLFRAVRAVQRHARGVIALGLALGLALLAAACSIKRVARVDPASVTDLSGGWNDVDSRLVANELIGQVIGASWARDWAAAHGGETPTVIIGEFRNRTLEHIPIGTFQKDLERAFIGSSAVTLVASRGEREEVRAERLDQQANAAADTRARLAREQGARFVLQGDVQEITDSQGREKIVYYQVDCTLIDLETNAKVWAGQHKIKKYIQQRRITP